MQPIDSSRLCKVEARLVRIDEVTRSFSVID